MRRKVLSYLCCLFAICAAAASDAPAPLPFKPPFAVKNAMIVDQDGRKVKLWGVNYHAPFNHNFVNIRQTGVTGGVAEA
jgi:hypothetical protein